MNKRQESKLAPQLLAALLLLSLSGAAFAQRPQDNWYLENVWAKDMTITNGGLSAPYGVAVGPDQRIYVGDEGSGRVNVYLPDGTFSFAITNGFGEGESFSNPRGMIIDQFCKLYVADSGQNCVFVFNTNGAFLLKVGGTNGAGDGELSGVMDVGVSRAGEIYVLENGNCRVSIFNTNGAFRQKWGEFGFLDGQLYRPSSIAVALDERVYICQPRQTNGPNAFLKVFDKDGKFLTKLDFYSQENETLWYPTYNSSVAHRFMPGSVRVDASGMIHVYCTCSFSSCPSPPFHGGAWSVLYPDLSTCMKLNLGVVDVNAVDSLNALGWPCHALSPDGSMIICNRKNSELWVYRSALREQRVPPRNAIPMPTVLRKQQRANSPLVDIDYQVIDADDTTVTAAMLVFTNSSATPALVSCIRHPTLVEGTATNLGPGIPANEVHRITWNAGADWSVNLGQYRVAILARDNRPGLLDIHYTHLPAGSGMPALKISRSPLVQSDFMQVWWWLLATNEVGITLSSNRIYGVAGTYNSKVLCEDEITTADGRAFIREKMRVREATAEEVQWAKQATLPAGTSPNQWPPGRSVGGRPEVVNEYGFDTGNWDTNVCYWVVPLN